jgi:hypothetical protein
VQERAGHTLELIGIGNDFLNRTQKAQQLREIIDKMGLHEIKNFCTTKEMITRLKSPPTQWEKIIASYTSGKGIIIRIYKDLKKLNSPKINDSLKKCTKELNRTFSKEQVQMAKEYMKKGSPSLAIGNANQNHTKIPPHSC